MRPGKWWVKKLLRGMHLSFKKPAKCLKELHSPALQEANTHRLFTKLCWLMDKHAVSADRVVNIDETSCRLLPVHQTGWGRRGVKQAQLQGNTREATTFTVAFSMGVDRWTCSCRSCTRARQTPFAGAALAGAHPPRHIGERLGHDDDAPAAHSHIGRRAQSRHGGTVVDPSLGHGQHPGQRGHPGRHEGRIPSHRAVLHPAAQHVVLAALRLGRLPQLQELHPGSSKRHACPLRHRRLIRRPGHEQSMAAPVFGRMGISCSHGLMREEPGVDNWMASLARRQQRRVPRCRDGGRGTQFSRRALLQAHRAGARSRRPRGLGHGRGVDAPMPDAPPEPELIDVPPAPASAPPMSNLERCIALRLVYGAGPR